MAKKRFQCWLSEEALAELERRAGAPNKRQVFLERLLTNGLRQYDDLAGRIKDGRDLVDAGEYHPRQALRMAEKQVERIERQIQFCEHGAAPGLCKVSKCRKT